MTPDKVVFIETRETERVVANLLFLLSAVLGGGAALLVFGAFSRRSLDSIEYAVASLVGPILLFAGGWGLLRHSHRQRRMIVCFRRGNELLGYFVRGVRPTRAANDESQAAPIQIQLVECRVTTLGKCRTFHGVLAFINGEMMPLGILKTVLERDAYAEKLPLFMRPCMRRVDTPIEFAADIKILEPPQ